MVYDGTPIAGGRSGRLKSIFRRFQPHEKHCGNRTFDDFELRIAQDHVLARQRHSVNICLLAESILTQPDVTAPIENPTLGV